MLELALGNPLALRELPSLLSEEQRRGAAPIDPVSAPGGALGEALGRRVASAGPEAAALLLVAAASGDRPLEPVIAACRDLGIADQALERCEAAGLLDTHAGSFTLAHPLLRSVIYGGASPGERRRAHRALADHTLADSRAWHLAAATIGPDDELAAELDRAAERAAGRGAHEAAADAMERGAQASSGLAARSGRLYAAGLAAAMGGAYERSAALLEAASEIDDPAMRALSRHLLAMVTLNGGIRNGLDNHRMLTTEAERIEPIDPAMAALLHADAGVTATVVGLCDLVLGSAERAVAALPPDAPPSIRCQTHAIHGMGLALKGRTAEAAAALDRADELLGEVEPVSAAAQSISFALHGTVLHRPGAGCFASRPGGSPPPPARAGRSGSCRGSSSRPPMPPTDSATGRRPRARSRTRSRTPRSRGSGARSSIATDHPREDPRRSRPRAGSPRRRAVGCRDRRASRVWQRSHLVGGLPRLPRARARPSRGGDRGARAGAGAGGDGGASGPGARSLGPGPGRGVHPRRPSGGRCAAGGDARRPSGTKRGPDRGGARRALSRPDRCGGLRAGVRARTRAAP